MDWLKKVSPLVGRNIEVIAKAAIEIQELQSHKLHFYIPYWMLLPLTKEEVLTTVNFIKSKNLIYSFKDCPYYELPSEIEIYLHDESEDIFQQLYSEVSTLDTSTKLSDDADDNEGIIFSEKTGIVSIDGVDIPIPPELGLALCKVMFRKDIDEAVFYDKIHHDLYRYMDDRNKNYTPYEKRKRISDAARAVNNKISKELGRPFKLLEMKGKSLSRKY